MYIKFNEFLFENNLQNIKFVEEFVEDEFTIKAFYDEEEIGFISFFIFYDAYDQEFYDILSIEEYDNIFDNDDILISLSYLNVDPEFRGLGIAKMLVEKGLNFFKKKGYNKFFLNASPMRDGNNFLNLKNLVNFYEKFGFKVLKDQKNNVIMYLIS